MNRWLAVVFALAIVAIVVAVFLLSGSQQERVAIKPAAQSSASSEPAQAPAPPAPEPDVPRGDDRTALAVPSAQTPAQEPTRTAVNDGLAELRGRFVLPGGAPATGVKLHFIGWQANHERVLKFGAPKAWPELDAASDADGRFAFRFDPPRAFQFMLNASLDGYASVAWRWDELPQRAVTDAGEIALILGGSIRGRIVDKGGKPVGGNWSVSANTKYRSRGAGGDATRAHAEVDAITSEFRLAGLPPGGVELKAYSRIANWIDGPRVEVRAREEVSADIVYDGPDNSRRIVVILFCRPFYVFENDPQTIMLLGAPGGERFAKKIEHSSQSWSFDDVPPGTYTVEVRDPRFLPWSRAGVQPGRSVDAHLKGSGAMRLSVSDDKGQAIESYRLRLRFRYANFSPNEFELRTADDPLPNGGLYDGLISSMDFTLIVEAANKGSREVDVDALAPNETRAVSVALASSGTVRGRITGASPAALAGASVLLAPESAGAAAALDYVQGVPSSGIHTPTGVRETEADGEGRFAFEGLAQGRYIAAARVNAYLKIASDAFEVPGGAIKNVDIALPPTSFVAGHLVVPDGTKLDRMLIDECTVGNVANIYQGWKSFEGPPPPRAQVGADGRFRLGPLPAGEYEFSLEIADAPLPSDLRHWEGEPVTRFALGRAKIAPPADIVVEYDVREKFPGRLTVSATVDGAPAAGCVVTAEGTRPSEPQHIDYAGAQVGADGMAHFAAIIPATWKLALSAGDNSWTVVSDATVTIVANSAANGRIDVTLYSGTLRVLDVATGKPLAQHQLGWTIHDGNTSKVRSDANGNITVRLPMGRYKVADQGDGNGSCELGAAVDVEWTPTGPVPVEVRLELAKKVDLKSHGQ